MVSRRSSMELMKSLCDEVREDDGVDPRFFKKREQTKRSDKRTWQLCAQVRRCLELAVPEIAAGRGIPFCCVHAVVPAPDASRLRVEIVTDAACRETTRVALRDRLGHLRQEVARSIHRKRVPELMLVVIGEGEVTDGAH